MGSPGVEEVRYLAPVRPGDRLTLRLEVLDARASRSRPEMGIIRFRSEMVNADGAAVIRLTSTMLMGRRQAPAGQAAAADTRSEAP
jgi:acyl dehydratase